VISWIGKVFILLICGKVMRRNILNHVRKNLGKLAVAGLTLMALTGCERESSVARHMNEQKAEWGYRDFGSLYKPNVGYDDETGKFRISDNNESYLVAPKHFDWATEKGRSGEILIREVMGEIHATEFR